MLEISYERWKLGSLLKRAKNIRIYIKEHQKEEKKNQTKIKNIKLNKKANFDFFFFWGGGLVVCSDIC